jgi:hypothetical protein
VIPEYPAVALGDLGGGQGQDARIRPEQEIDAVLDDQPLGEAGCWLAAALVVVHHQLDRYIPGPQFEPPARLLTLRREASGQGEDGTRADRAPHRILTVISRLSDRYVDFLTRFEQDR